MLDIGGISLDRIMTVDPDAEGLKLCAECARSGLGFVHRHNNASDVESEEIEDINKTKHVGVVCDAEVSAFFILFNIARIYYNNYLCLILELEKHLHLTVGLESGKDSRRMVIVIKLSSEFKIKLSSEAVNSFSDMLRLKSQIFVVIKSDLMHVTPNAVFGNIQKYIIIILQKENKCKRDLLF